MNDLFYLSRDQLERLQPFFPKSHGVPRVDDLKVISGIIRVLKRGLQWRDAPREYGPHKTLYNLLGANCYFPHKWRGCSSLVRHDVLVTMARDA